jgi:hypothetical protein
MLLGANDAIPAVGVTPIAGTWVEFVAIGALCVFFALLAAFLSYLARRHLRRAPLWMLVPLCGVSVPLLCFIAGYIFFNRDVGIFEWLERLPFRAYRNFALIFVSGNLGAWLVLRNQRAKIDLDAFD